jgi:AraC family transcriptional regulator of adaptative response/methylated-DNA-[protein]-cysteine methyltransferase
MKPREYKKEAMNQEIRFAVENTNLGWVMVAATEIGICAIALGDNPDELANEIYQRFPQAKLGDDDPIFQQWVADIVSTIEMPRRSLNLPLDIQGTAFQQQVWRVLQTIPVGSTLSYQQVATQIGNPKAVRAVASACAANKLAIAIPCHRVVGSNGSLSGYRWGVDRKQALLELEKKPLF